MSSVDQFLWFLYSWRRRRTLCGFGIDLKNTDIQLTGHVVNRVTTILADTILIVVTLKFLPASGIVTYHDLTKGWKLKGLAYIMLCNGMSTLELNRGSC